MLYSGAATPVNGWGGTLCISGWNNDTTDPAGVASQQADCEIAELVQYNRRLSDAERATGQSYLRAKWNAPTTMFTPTDLGARCVAWFDGADLSKVTITGAGVSAWANKGSAG